MAAPVDHWSLDKRIPVALILTMAIQLAGIVWWARGVTSMQEQFITANAEQDRRITTLETAKERERVGERMATIESEIRHVSDVVRRIDERMTKGKP